MDAPALCHAPRTYTARDFIDAIDALQRGDRIAARGFLRAGEPKTERFGSAEIEIAEAFASARAFAAPELAAIVAWAVSRGVVMLRLVRERLGANADHAREASALCAAAALGCRELLRELRVGFGLTVEDARAGACAAPWTAIFAGSAEAAREFCVGFGVTKCDLHHTHHDPSVCKMHEIIAYTVERRLAAAALRVLRTEFGFAAGDICNSDDTVLSLAVAHNQIDTLRELREGYGIAVEPPRRPMLIAIAASRGAVDALRVLRTEFKVSRIDAISEDGLAAIRLAVRNGQVAALREIRAGFDLESHSVWEAFGGDFSAVYDENEPEYLYGLLADRIAAVDELVDGFGLADVLPEFAKSRRRPLPERFGEEIRELGRARDALRGHYKRLAEQHQA